MAKSCTLILGGERVLIAISEEVVLLDGVFQSFTEERGEVHGKS